VCEYNEDDDDDDDDDAQVNVVVSFLCFLGFFSFFSWISCSRNPHARTHQSEKHDKERDSLLLLLLLQIPRFFVLVLQKKKRKSHLARKNPLLVLFTQRCQKRFRDEIFFFEKEEEKR
tara:strand:- start:536 stop:889 length:354 start_codon:yes stop_codon:yes gene_type:complete